MSETEKIVFTSALTILGGLAVYTSGQLLSKFLIEPVQNLKILTAHINFQLISYSEHFGKFAAARKSQEWRTMVIEARSDIKNTAGRILEVTELIPFYSLLSFLGLIPSLAVMASVARELLLLSHLIFEDDRAKATDCMERIRLRLKFKLNL